MSKLVVDDISKYYASLDDAKEDGLTPIPVKSVVQFYKLKGRTTVISVENLEPICYVLYTIFSPVEDRYYLRSFRNIPLNDLFFYENRLTFAEDVPIEQLRRYAFDGNVTLLMNAKQVEDMKAMLQRVSKANLNNDKIIKYKNFVQLCEVSLNRERHAEYGKSKDNYKTQLSLYDQQIAQIWINVK